MIGAGATVAPSAKLERVVVWPESIVFPDEHLVDAIRAERLTVVIR